MVTAHVYAICTLLNKSYRIDTHSKLFFNFHFQIGLGRSPTESFPSFTHHLGGSLWKGLTCNTIGFSILYYQEHRRRSETALSGLGNSRAEVDYMASIWNLNIKFVWTLLLNGYKHHNLINKYACLLCIDKGVYKRSNVLFTLHGKCSILPTMFV